jgi:hypothetical protein
LGFISQYGFDFIRIIPAEVREFVMQENLVAVNGNKRDTDFRSARGAHIMAVDSSLIREYMERKTDALIRSQTPSALFRQCIVKVKGRCWAATGARPNQAPHLTGATRLVSRK